MLDGIEVLNKSEIYDMPLKAVEVAFYIGVIIGIIVGIVVFREYVKTNKFKIRYIIFSLMYGVMLWFISLILAGILFTYTWKEPTGRYKYQATISDNVSFNEVYDKYYIKDLKGKIYTIEDKEK